jgi:hypothetical protein
VKTVAFAFSALVLATAVAGAGLAPNTAGLTGTASATPVTVVVVELPAR